MKSIIAFINDNRIPTLVFAVWGMAVMTFVVMQVFRDITLINASVVSALGVIFGLPAIIATVLKWRQS